MKALLSRYNLKIVMALAPITATPEHQRLHEPALSSFPPTDQENLEGGSHLSETSFIPLREQFTASDNTGNPQHSGLSPQRLPSLPRAWERRPATPYGVRNDTQKIWKRVPLGSVGVSETQRWRKETGRLNTRPVKRLRVGDDEDKENVYYIESKYDGGEMATPSPKRKAEECGASMEPQLETDSPNISVCADNVEEIGAAQHQDEAKGKSSPDLRRLNEGEVINDEIASSNDQAPTPSTSNAVLPSIEAEEPALSPPCPSSHTLMPSPLRELLRSSPTALDSCKELPRDEVAIAQGTLQSVYATAEEENTALLSAFLSRSRAQKEVKEKAQQENAEQAGATKAMCDGSIEEAVEVHQQTAEETTIDPPETIINFSFATNTDPNMSPRRSSRLTTRLPQFRKQVPQSTSKIALKRLTDFEFVANNHENQSLAVTTRLHTKSNKFGALTVKARLIQLTAEAVVRGPPGLDTDLLDQGSDIEQKTKKGKGISWAETLATYQDGSNSLIDTPDVDVPMAESDLPDEQYTERDPCSDIESKQENLADQSVGALVELLHQKQDSGGVKKVRRLRRMNNGGTANGTPAPKKFALPVPVGSNLPVPASIRSRLKLETEAMLVFDKTSTRRETAEAGGAEEGVQTRTRSRSLRSD